jgi:hypothetical protein
MEAMKQRMEDLEHIVGDNYKFLHAVHTTLSITHHTRKRPSTGPRTTHGPQSPP